MRGHKKYPPSQLAGQVRFLYQMLSIKQSRMTSILSCFAAGSEASLSARWVHRSVLSAWTYGARIESAVVLRALQSIMTVSKAGKREPHSMRETVFEVQPTSSANCSWVSFRCFRMRWRLRPPALKSINRPPFSLHMPIMPIFARVIHFLMDICIRNVYTHSGYIRRRVMG